MPDSYFDADTFDDVNIFDTIGTSGLRRTGGTVLEEWLARLQGLKGVYTYREMMDNDPVIGGFMFMIKNLLRTVDWRVKPADDDDQAAIDEAVFIDECMTDMSHTWDSLLSEALTMLGQGWAFHEIIYKRRLGAEQKDPRLKSKHNDGRIGWRKIPLRKQETLWEWVFDGDGGVRGMIQMDNWAGITGPRMLPIEKALLFRLDSDAGNPEGRSILRSSVRPYWFLKRIQEIEAIGIERDLAGYPFATVPARLLMRNASAADKSLLASIERKVTQVKRDEREGGVWPAELDENGKPTGFSFKLLSTGGRRQIDTTAIITRYEMRIATSVMADFMLLGQDKVGSFSLASEKTHMFSVAIQVVINAIANVFNDFAIPRLMALNRVPQALWPTIVCGDIETPDIEKVGKYLVALASANVLGSHTELERASLEFAGLPVPDIDEHSDEFKTEEYQQPELDDERDGERNEDL